jgi:hypothetical protein
MYRTLLSLLFVPSIALAGNPELPIPGNPLLQETGAETPPSGAPIAPGTPAPTMERPYHHEISFRGRMLSVPASILDIWYFNEEEEGWALPDQGRPRAKGYALGLEYVIKGEAANGIFYFDYADSTMDEGYWDDREEPEDHDDGSYLRPSKNFGLVALGADFGYEVHFVRTEDTNGNFGLSLMPGAGLGVALVTGEIEEWTYCNPGDEGCTAGEPAFQRLDEPADGPLAIPKVLPMVDINLSLRFNFADRAVLRIEGGLHSLIYYGAAFGIMF